MFNILFKYYMYVYIYSYLYSKYIIGLNRTHKIRIPDKYPMLCVCVCAQTVYIYIYIIMIIMSLIDNTKHIQHRHSTERELSLFIAECLSRNDYIFIFFVSFLEFFFYICHLSFISRFVQFVCLFVFLRDIA